MYEYIKGTVAEVAPAYAVIDVGGVGYYLHISLETYSAIEHETETRLYVHYVVREDAQLLYGFSTKAERELFRLLISVSGVGGNTARMILSTYSPRELQGIITAGNAVLLRGGSEALRSNLALGSLLSEALAGAGLPAGAVQLIDVTDRAAVGILCRMDEFVDVLIPRGGEALVRAVAAEAAMPVLRHFMGVCHAFVDEGADLPQALDIVFNGKVQRPGVCNALECLLVHRTEAARFLPMVGERLGGAGVEFRACPRSLPLLGARAKPQTEDDLGREFHDLVLAVRVVENMDEALAHIARYGSRHTEIICTRDHVRAMRFLREADASMVAVNASTRFNDGGQLGLGAEIGISTSKLHAYGPMGVRELTTTKFVVFGQGQVRS